MTHSSTLAILAIAMTITAGCDNAADEQDNANAAQAEANSKMNQAQAQANSKMKAAQADADRKIAEAQASFMKLREDYRHAMTTKLAELDRKVTKQEARAKTVSGKARTELDADLTTIRANRDRLATNFNALETATATTWDATTAQLDREWMDLKALVDKG